MDLKSEKRDGKPGKHESISTFSALRNKSLTTDLDGVGITLFLRAGYVASDPAEAVRALP